MHSAVQSQFGRGVACAHAFELRVEQAGEVRARTVHRQVGADLAGDVLAESRQIDIGQGGLGVHRLCGLFGDDVGLAAAQGQVELGAAMGAIEGDDGGRDRAEARLANLA